MKRFKLAAVSICLVIVLGHGATVYSETITWRMPTSWPKGTILQWAPELFAKIVGEMSGGRLNIKVFPAGAIMGPLEVFDAVNSGAIQATHSGAAYFIGKDPSAALFTAVPGGLDAIPNVAWYFEGDGLKLLDELYAKYNFGFVSPCGIIPSDMFGWSHKPITKLEDFKGLKFRALGYWGEILSEMGTSVVMLPGSEVYPALQRKVLDAAEMALPNIDRDLGLNEICEYLTVPGPHQPSSFLHVYVSQKAWDKLPPDLKAIVKYASQATTMRVLIRSVWLDAPALEEFKNYGTKIHYLDPKVQKQIAQIANEFLDKKAAQDPFFAKVLKSQRSWQKSYKTYYDLMENKFD